MTNRIQTDRVTSQGLRHRRRAIPYPAIEQHGIIGDRRTAGLVAADGTLDWLCLPDFDGTIVFGALLDWFQGGYWRLGPARMLEGKQNYLGDSMVLETRWDVSSRHAGAPGCHALAGKRAAARPRPACAPSSACCVASAAHSGCEMDLQAGCNFQERPQAPARHGSDFTVPWHETSLRFWSNRPPGAHDSGLRVEFELNAGEELWTVLELGAAGHSWSVESARNALDSTRQVLATVGGRAPQSTVRSPRSTVHGADVIAHFIGYSTAAHGR